MEFELDLDGRLVVEVVKLIGIATKFCVIWVELQPYGNLVQPGFNEIMKVGISKKKKKKPKNPNTGIGFRIAIFNSNSLCHPNIGINFWDFWLNSNSVTILILTFVAVNTVFSTYQEERPKMTTRIAPGVGANLLGQHSAERNQDATSYVGNLDPQVQLPLYLYIFELSLCTGVKMILSNS